MDSIVQLAVAGTTLDHRDANLSVMKFLVELVKCTYVEQVRIDEKLSWVTHMKVVVPNRFFHNTYTLWKMLENLKVLF